MIFVELVEMAFNAVHDRFHHFRIRPWQENNEIITAVARNDIFLAENVGKKPGNIDEHLIPGVQAKSIIQIFKRVYFCGYDADRVKTAVFQPFELGFKEKAVVESGQGIMRAEVSHAVACVSNCLGLV